MFIDPKFARRFQLVEILEAMCQGLELTASQAEDAEQRYNNVGRWLGDDPMLEGAWIYVHGSVALGTTVKPLARAEYDVDLVCHIPHGSPTIAPAVLKKVVGDRLKDRGTYVRLIEEMRRCWRLNYAGEFHMDITPSIPNPACVLAGELVPDKELRQWKPTNPVGYRRLFERRALLQPVFHLLKTEGYRGAARDAAIEPYPAQTRIKGLLRRAVQLCKRHRDVYFTDRPEIAPLSIIITTLAARSYEWCINNRVFNDELEVLVAVLQSMPNFMSFDGRAWSIPNETTQGENFAEKWNAKPELAGAFYAWHRECVRDLERLLETVGRDRLQMSLAEAFGPSAASKAMQPLTDRVASDRAAGRLAVAPGLGLISTTSAPRSTPVRPNTFFGAS
jgi:hypothetical protein